MAEGNGNGEIPLSGDPRVDALGGREEGGKEDKGMSESEKYEAQGRAQAALKQARSNAATLNTLLNEQARVLAEVSGLLARFAREPLFKDASFIRLSEHLKGQLSLLPDPRSIAAQVDELVSESTRAKELQESVDRF